MVLGFWKVVSVSSGGHEFDLEGYEPLDLLPPGVCCTFLCINED